jgi:hypothetical protein
MSGYSMEEIIGQRPGTFCSKVENLNPEVILYLRNQIEKSLPFSEIINYSKY